MKARSSKYLQSVQSPGNLRPAQLIQFARKTQVYTQNYYVLFLLMYSLHLLLLQLYLTFHSYGQYILYPWGYARKDTLDKKDLHNLGVKGAQAVRSLSGRKYSVGSAAKMLYPAAGT